MNTVNYGHKLAELPESPSIWLIAQDKPGKEASPVWEHFAIILTLEK